MEDFDDNFMRNSDLSELTGRFEKMLDDGTLLYYEVDDLDQLLDHYLIHHRLELAFKVIEITKSQYPSNRQMTIREAELLLLSDRKAEAVELLKEVENLESFNPDYHIICAQAHSQSGHYDDAVISLERALECSPEESDHIHLNIAIEYQNMENYSAAIDHLKKALNQNPNNSKIS